jgi:endoglycosylceramidase
MRRALLLAVVAGCGEDGPRCAGDPVCAGQVRDAEGRAVIMRGMNVSGGNKTAPYLDFHGEADLARMRDDWGMNAIRWVMPWAAVEPAPGDHDDAYLDAVAERLDWAAAHDLLVVLDMHQDVYGEGFGFDGAPRWTCDEAHYQAFERVEPWPLNYLDEHVIACFDGLWTDPALGASFAAAWRRVAERLGEHPAVVGFDVINEPSWGSYGIADFERERLAPFVERVIAEVRAAAPRWIAFVEPASSRNLGVPTSFEPFGVPDVVYAPHLYDSDAETGGGFDPARRQAMLDNVARMREEATRLDAALWIGEYGGLGSDPQIGAYMDAAYDGAAAAAASSIYWDYGRGGGYAPLDAEGDEVTAITDAIVRPYPARIAGDPVDWRHDETSGALTLRWRPDRAIALPTEIVVPARLAPAGVAIDCDGCAWSIAGDLVRIDAPPAVDADGIAAVTVSPAS